MIRVLLVLVAWISISLANTNQAIGLVRVAAIRISFQEDNNPGTTGNGSFLYSAPIDTCGKYTIDPIPHDRSYFESQLLAVSNYFKSVSYNKFGIDMDNSMVYPISEEASYILSNQMNYYHPFNQEEIHDERITELFRDAIDIAYTTDSINFSLYDHIVIFHAGIGQDFSLPFLDPTPEDIPSTFVDKEMLDKYLGGSIEISNSVIDQGIILPETQNHLFFEDSENIFLNAEEPCDYQYGLTGTFALMLGFAIGLPPLWDTETGQSGIGIFGLMDQGSNNGRGLIPAPPDAWTRKHIGWEYSTRIIPPASINLPSRSENNIIEIPINDDEYFLIENRTNWYRDKMYIDSTRYNIYENSNRYPPFVEILFDSVLIDQDDNGVVTNVYNYDLGLPSSGILIWHIDEVNIDRGINTYSINNDRLNRGVDLEESDGAQDIGFPSIFLFSDPSAGYFGDMWFKGNPEYERSNPSMDGLFPEFSHFSYPSTESNSGSASFITIDNIGHQSDTMHFNVYNSLLADGFPDSSLHIRLVYDLDNNGLMDIVGGVNNLWIAEEGNLLNKQYFYSTINNIYDISIRLFNNSNQLVILEKDDIASYVNFYKKNSSLGNLEYVFSDTLEMLDAVFINNNSNNLIYKEATDLFFNTAYSINNDGSTDSISGYPLLSISDLDLDGQSEYLVVKNYNQNTSLSHIGTLEVRNINNNVMVSGFPVDSISNQYPALIKDLYGDEHPEIIVKSKNDEIIIINWKGEIEYNLVNDGSLICLAEYQDKNSIITSSSIWLFDEVSENRGNQWATKNHDFGNSRTLQLHIPEKPYQNTLIDKNKTYAYPNPAYNEKVNFRIAVESAEKIDIMIYDVAGYFIHKINFMNPIMGMIEEKVWNVDQIEPGVYFANITAWSGDTSETEILKVVILN
ncbi:MAG: T9SS type A sorting domain-containing protein [Candidatus Neomarinimicrobiota bacterium]|nr:T9SS type A sorting domain-containing protein [Candidatus Neomarinimicrobiota bacterium]